MTCVSIRNLKFKTEIKKGSYSDKHIIFGVDHNYISHAFVAISSIIESHPDDEFNFHLITDSQEYQKKDIALELLNNSKHGFAYHLIDKSLLAELPCSEQFTIATYFRMLAPIILKDIKVILYLDADMIVKNSIIELWNYLPNSNYIASVVEDRREIQKQLSSGARLKNDRYFNAGMMLIDVKKWNDNNITSRAINILADKNNSFQYLDQDALNNVLEGKVLYISNIYNYLIFLSHNKKSYSSFIPEEICVIHYTGCNKPWQIWNDQDVCKFYKKHLNNPILNIKLETIPNNLEQIKGAYKWHIRNCNFLDALIWRIKFLILRNKTNVKKISFKKKL
jgi:lipopolysaccharide biosynthesis glycosyltransferase